MTKAKATNVGRRWPYNVNDGDDCYDPACGQKSAFIEGALAENFYVYCPYCGRQIKEGRPK